MSYTLTYSEQVQGWPSFYSFYPDWIIGMNNYLYTFKGGDLYRHNVNNAHNTFYEQYWIKAGTPGEAFKPATLIGVFNDVVLENKLFKTIKLEGDSVWDFTLQTDIQDSGYISSSWFEKKEASYFAFIRNNSSGELSIRSTNGIGRSSSVTGGGTEVNFSVNPLIIIDGIMSVGDYIYFSIPPVYNVFYLAGAVSNVIRNYRAGVNQIVVDTSIPGAVAISAPDNYYFFVKNSVAESHGVLGHYCVFNIANYSSSKIELFTVGSEVMKSFP